MPFIPRIFKIRDRSMEPYLKTGDYVVACAFPLRISALKAGDVVVCRHPSKDMVLVKRVRSIDGRGLFLEGDNKAMSSDSRDFGRVEIRSVIGKVLFRVPK